MAVSITPISSDVARRYREEIRSGRRPGRHVVLEEAGAPCRHCLQPGQVGDAMLLFTYQPFTGDGPYAVPSPIYLHAGECGRYERSDEIPPLLRDGLRAVRSYDDADDLVDGVVVAGTELEAAIGRLFDDERAAYLHVHSATAGCFTCRIDRSPPLVTT